MKSTCGPTTMGAMKMVTSEPLVGLVTILPTAKVVNIQTIRVNNNSNININHINREVEVVGVLVSMEVDRVNMETNVVE